MHILELNKKHFNSEVNLGTKSDSHFEHAERVVKAFGITSFKEYHDLYLKIDVSGLRDVFEYHRELTFKTNGLQSKCTKTKFLKIVKQVSLLCQLLNLDCSSQTSKMLVSFCIHFIQNPGINPSFTFSDKTVVLTVEIDVAQ